MSGLPGRIVRSRWLPTRRDDASLVATTAWRVLSRPFYLIGGIFVSLLVLTSFAAAENLDLFVFALTGPLTIDGRLSILLSQYPFLGVTTYPFSDALLIVLAVAAGINGAIALYHFREHGLSVREGGGGILGLVVATLGVGCPTCGTAVLAGLLSLVGVTGGLSVLPFEGLSFAVLGLVMLGLSSYWLAEGMRSGEVEGCPVPRR